MEGTVIAFREINEWKFNQPVYIGDTVHAVLVVQEIRPLRRLGGGAVVIEIDVRNQKNVTVMKGKWTVLMASRPSESS
jgi:acyl dehydratase